MKNNKNGRDLDLTLIHPPALMAKSNYSTITQPPLGLAYLSAVVMEKGYTVEVVDAVGEAIGRFENWNENDEFIIQGLSINDVVESINPKTDFIGITCMFTHSWPMVRQLINRIREKFPEKLIIGGGEHITSMYELVMRETLLDGCVLGEGEETLLDILNAGANQEKWADIKGFCFRSSDDDGSLVVNPRRDRIRAVDDIPWPKWELMNPMKYLDSKVYIGPSTGRTMPMLATRGCPYQCTFCSSPSMWTTRYWTRSPKDVVDEMVYYYEKYDATEFQFQDLTAIMDHAGIHRAHFFGFSMGGWIGYGILKYAPQRFHSVVIGGFGPLPDPYFGVDPAELARGSVERRLATDPDEYEVIHAVFRETAAFEGAQDAVRAAPMPLLFFAGTQEPRYESVKAAATLNPNASFFELPGLNHAETGQATTQYLPHLIDFFDRVTID